MQSQQNTPVASSSSTISGKAGSGSGKVGILLMDHGSRNEASNQRLEHLAELYKLTMQDDNVVVLAAHMEIAKPTIPDGLQALLDQGVGTYHIIQYTKKKIERIVTLTCVCTVLYSHGCVLFCCFVQ